jgi:hypothetical protein
MLALPRIALRLVREIRASDGNNGIDAAAAISGDAQAHRRGRSHSLLARRRPGGYRGISTTCAAASTPSTTSRT